jgi:phosphatidylglycerophosphate synthase
MRRESLAEIRDRTCKPLDSWWTVVLVDPYAVRLVRLVSPWRRVTPDRLTALSAVFGLAAAACFAAPGRWWPVAGALFFHLGFVADCMDGKLARLRGSGSLFGAWCDFMLDRLRAIGCAAALMGGHYLRTGQVRYLWLVALVIALDLLRYLNAGQITQLREEAERARAAYAIGLPVAPPDSHRGRVKAALAARRIRVHLFSGIEFEMTVFVIGPVTGFIGGAALAAAVLLAIFELRLVVHLWQVTRAPAVHSLPTASISVSHSITAEASLIRQPAGG